MKYAFIKEHQDRYPVAALCRFLKVSRSGYHAWLDRPACARQVRDQELLIAIRRIHMEHRQRYGSVKTWKTLNASGMACGKHRIARLRRAHGIEAARRTRQRTTVEHHKMAAPAPDLVMQQFTAEKPNRIWSGDMTFIRTREGWLHLAVLVDVFSRVVVGHATDSRPGQALHVGALQMAIKRRKPPTGLIHHTDRGSQYRSGAYRAVMEQHGLVASMNGRKIPQDNAIAESFFSTLKNELIHHVDLPTREAARKLIVDYIERFYNRIRIHQSLGYRTPEQFEMMYRGA